MSGYVCSSFSFFIGAVERERRRTVKTAMQMVLSINEYEDLYFNSGGGVEESLLLHAKISRVMIEVCEIYAIYQSSKMKHARRLELFMVDCYMCNKTDPPDIYNYERRRQKDE